MTNPRTEVYSHNLKAVDSRPRRRNQLQHMATIDLGSLDLEFEDEGLINRSRSQEEAYPNIKIVKRKEYWYKTSKNEKRKNRSVQVLRKSQSMEFDDHSEDQDVEPKIYKLPSETDIQDYPALRSFESRDIDVSDIYVKVPIHF